MNNSVMMKICVNKKTDKTVRFPDFEKTAAQGVRAYHESIPAYAPTPLRELDAAASQYGVSGIYVKDESYRFSLNAFKVLGGSYAIGKILEKDPSVKTVITATDGNHGRGVAWSAREFGLESVVYMPRGTAEERLENILKLGSDASITDLSYDDAVRKARKDAEKNGWTLVQDTSWEGYEEVPTLIMQGYTTMALEAFEQLDGKEPTHIFLQAGVGSMAAAVAAFFTNICMTKPVIVIVEPDNANCLFLTAEASDGETHAYEGEMNTIMAGLACGEPCTVAWKILEKCADFFVSIPDDAAGEGMRELARYGIESGESGASTYGFFSTLMEGAEYCEMRNTLGIDENTVALFFSTEGATDRKNYEKIVGKK